MNAQTAAKNKKTLGPTKPRSTGRRFNMAAIRREMLARFEASIRTPKTLGPKVAS